MADQISGKQQSTADQAAADIKKRINKGLATKEVQSDTQYDTYLKGQIEATANEFSTYSQVYNYLKPLQLATVWGNSYTYNLTAVYKNLVPAKIYGIIANLTGGTRVSLNTGGTTGTPGTTLNDIDAANISDVLQRLASLKETTNKKLKDLINEKNNNDKNLKKVKEIVKTGNPPKPPVSAATDTPYKGADITKRFHAFNLPPHAWSLPLRPATVNPELVQYSNSEPESFHGTRRGLIYYWADASSINKIDTSTGSVKTLQGTAATPKGKTTSNVVNDREYAFQFLWNPQSISTSTSMNLDVTPSTADRLRAVTGIYPGQETLSLSLVLDRTNDFACFASSKTSSDISNLSRYYQNASPYDSLTKEPQSNKIKELINKGTVADLEYLFKAINGTGTGSSGKWVNPLNRETADIGYLAPTLLAFQLGPDHENNLSYVGWINNLSINHTAFTETMIPIRTEVTIQVNCFAGSGIISV